MQLEEEVYALPFGSQRTHAVEINYVLTCLRPAWRESLYEA
jgi:hypothetical protein